MARRVVLRTRSRSPDDDARRHLFVAARAAMRALAALYAEPEDPAGTAEAYASETLCLIGLVRATLGKDPPAAPEALVQLSHRVLSSWIMCPHRPNRSLALTCALGVRHAMVASASEELTKSVCTLAAAALGSLGESVVQAAEGAAKADVALARRDGVEAAGDAPLWPGPSAEEVTERLGGSRLGDLRLRGWYGMALRGGSDFSRRMGRALAQICTNVEENVGPLPGEVGVYLPAGYLDSVFTGRRGKRPPRPETPPSAAPELRTLVGGGGGASTGGLAGVESVAGVEGVGGAKEEARVEPVVNTAFATLQRPDQPLDPGEPLRPGQEAYFCLWHGEPDPRSIEATPTGLHTELLPERARLTVALFGFDDGLEILSGTGELQLTPSGLAMAVRQPDRGPQKAIPEDLLGARLFFRVRTPDRAGTVRLRCNIYWRQVLVQSRLITAQVHPTARRADAALGSTLDYNLTRSLRGAALEGIGEHRLSVMLNDGDSGTHQFRFLGKGAAEFVNDATFREGELEDVLKQARAALRMVAWGSADEWNNQAYKYENGASEAQFTDDLVQLAVAGFRFYDALVARLSNQRPDALAELMRSPGMVQFTARRSASELVPASLIYDRALDTGAATLTICPAFGRALAEQRPLAHEPCFEGACPSAGDDTVICPGGFWGYRHSIGVPVSQGEADDVATVIAAAPGPAMAACYYPGFAQWPQHEARLRAMFPDPRWEAADSRDAAKALLQRDGAHVVYFYCHGGMKGTVPFILVDRAAGITRDNIRAFKWSWGAKRPLVFINGCHTTALEPAHAFDFVTGFIETAHASGVIGTEITVFEPLASAFAESFLTEFVSNRRSVGESIRAARLELLRRRNPLGLVYIPFALASLRLA